MSPQLGDLAMLLVLFVHDDRSAEEQREGGLLGAVPLQHDPRWVLISTDVCPPSDALTRATRYALRSFASLAAPGLSRVDQALCPPAEGPAVGTDLDARSVAILSLAVSLALPLARSLARSKVPSSGRLVGRTGSLAAVDGQLSPLRHLGRRHVVPGARAHPGRLAGRQAAPRWVPISTDVRSLIARSDSLTLTRATCYALRSLARQEATS